MTDSFEFPHNWNRDDIMDSMFKPLAKNKYLNPEAYNEKIIFWSSLINDYALHHKLVFIDTTKLRTLFMRKHAHPHCLEQICEIMYNNKDLKLVSDYVFQDANSTWTKKCAGYAYSCLVSVKNSMHSVYDYSLSKETIPSNVKYVHVKVIEKMTQEMQSYIHGLSLHEPSDCIVYLDHFWNRMPDVYFNGRREDFNVVLVHMCRMKICLITMHEHKWVVKFINSPNQRILPNDFEILRISNDIIELHKRIASDEQILDSIERNIENIKSEKISSSSKKKKIMKLLVERKCMNNKIDKKQKFLDSLKSYIDTTNSLVYSDKQIKFMVSANNMMSNANSQINSDELNETMDALAENKFLSEEIQETLSRPTYDNKADEVSLEAEFNDIMLDDDQLPPFSATKRISQLSEEEEDEADEFVQAIDEVAELPSPPQHNPAYPAPESAIIN